MSAPVDLSRHAPRPFPRALYDQVARAYREPPRHYHDVAHVGEVAERFGEVARDLGWSRPSEVFLAVLFHDAIYIAGAKDNEVRSAALARRSIADHAPELDADRAAALIELTARHGSLTAEHIDAESALFLDCDMAILGASETLFDAYDDGVEREYAPIVPADAYRAGRLQFLQTLLAAPRLFLSDYFHARLDASARANLRRAVERLRATRRPSGTESTP